jgi:glycosyltransferase involved in cell wall biosynthesis
MRLCYLATASDTHARRWISYFIKKGYDIHIISYVYAPMDGVKLHTLPQFKNPQLSFVTGAFIIKKLIGKIRPDVLHVYSTQGYAPRAAFTGFHPFIVTPYGSDVLIVPKHSKTTKWLTTYTLKVSDLIVTDAEHEKEVLVRLGARPEKIIHVNFGVDILKFKPGSPKIELKKKLGLSDSPTVISLRSFEPIYDVETLILSIPLVLKEVPKTKFIIAGKGSQERMLKALAKSLGVWDNVVFVGYIPNCDLPQYLQCADIYVSTALSDGGLSASTAEAMGCGLPVIITDVADNRLWVKDGVSGFLIPPKDPKILAKRIIQLLSNEDLRKKFGMNARKIIEDKNNYYKEMAKMDRIYREIASLMKNY